MKRNVVARACIPIVVLFLVSLLLGSVVFAEKGAVQSGDAININAATVKELAALPGVGKKKAQAIVAYRVENGKFESVDEIKKIDGIGKKTFNKIRDRVVVE